MKQDKIKDIIRKKVNDIAGLCADIDTSFDKDTIHDFRVAVKTLRSFLRLQKMHTHNSKLKLTRKFKRLYDIAGVIREAQLELGYFEHNKTELPHYIDQLRQTLAQQKEEWEKHYSRKVLRKLGSKLTSFKYRSIQPDDLEQFFNNRMTAVDTITQNSSPTDTQVHTARKNIKDILYTSKIAGKRWKSAHKEVEAVPAKKLDKLADIIGNYNDERITLEHLNAFPLGNIGMDEKTTMHRLRNKQKQKLHTKKKGIIATVKQFTKDQRA